MNAVDHIIHIVMVMMLMTWNVWFLLVVSPIQVQRTMLHWRFSVRTLGNALKPCDSSFQTCRFRCCCVVPTLLDIPTMLTTLCLSEWSLHDGCFISSCSCTLHHDVTFWSTLVNAEDAERLCSCTVYMRNVSVEDYSDWLFNCSIEHYDITYMLHSMGHHLWQLL